MNLYYLVIAATTVLSPGPGVFMTLSNALRYGLKGTFGGILGIVCGTLFVATLSATGLGVLFATSTLAYTLLKFAGAIYLGYLGIRLWYAPPIKFVESSVVADGLARRFIEAFSMQLTNPKVLVFFLTILPQFITAEANRTMQFARLILIYGALVFVIHSLYALFARKMKRWLIAGRAGYIFNRIAAIAFICFGIILASVSH